ncbi:hypothetical protein RRG08_036765 [Elysia crispata]|uniref:Uncharacterized protein n=1 Tax=Elysia crispata TaxID=231223 RepID=A0AAE1CUJ1_9GAST|nr:hypothetical protein RRG08_036765 [Elysia crispata]
MRSSTNSSSLIGREFLTGRAVDLNAFISSLCHRPKSSPPQESIICTIHETTRDQPHARSQYPWDSISDWALAVRYTKLLFGSGQNPHCL